MIKIPKLKLTILVTTCAVLVAVVAQAAEVKLLAPLRTISPGNQFNIDVVLDTKGEAVNALEGQIVFPSIRLELVEIQSGNSIVSFWIEKPKVEAETIAFSGIIPGGFQGENGLIVSLLFEAKQPGAGRIAIKDVKVLKNDGAGTPAETTMTDWLFSISTTTQRVAVPTKEAKDQEPPESFYPEIGKDETLFFGKWFLVFATQDKASGIDHYEVKESRQRIFSLFQKWSRAESPQVLADQDLRSFIFVKAVDKAGQKRIMRLAPRYPSLWYQNYENLSIIIAISFLILFVTKKIWQKKSISE